MSKIKNRWYLVFYRELNKFGPIRAGFDRIRTQNQKYTNNICIMYLDNL